MQASTFFLDEWQASAAPLLYLPGCAGASPCSSANRQAMDPRTRQLLGPASAVAIGQIVAGTGNLLNGIVPAGQGISRYDYTWPAVVMAPRLGVAYDVSGTSRASCCGEASDCSMIGRRATPCIRRSATRRISTSRTVRYAQLQQLSSGLETQGPPQLNSIWPYEGDIPASTQWNAGVQMTLPWASAIDVSYVGQHGFNRLREVRGQQQVDVNAVDFGAAFLPQNQDPTLAPSSTPGAIRLHHGPVAAVCAASASSTSTSRITTRPTTRFSRTFNRRFRDGVAFGVNYTLGLSYTGNVGLTQRLDHIPDGTYTVRGRSGGLRRAQQGRREPPSYLEGELRVGSAEPCAPTAPP